MTGKTKAAMPGRQCNTALQKHRQITRLAAGGQTLSRRNPYAQINRVRLTYGDRDKGEQYSGSWQNNVKRGLEAPTKNVESCEDNQPSLRGEPLHNSLIVAQNRPFLRGAVHSITGSNPVQLSDSDLAFLRCRRLISPCNEVTINCAVLSPGSFKLSTLLAISCGTRALIFCDLLLTLSTAITGLLTLLWVPVYTKKSKLKHLMWVPVVDYSGCQMSVFAFTKKQRPTSVGSAGGASNHKPLVEVTVMADQQHTQTHPKFTWRFLALNRLDKKAKPCRLSVEAATEREARRILAPHFILSLAARLPAAEVNHG